MTTEKGRPPYPGKRPPKTSRNDHYHNAISASTQPAFNDVIASFRNFCIEHGAADFHPIADGAIHRGATKEHPHSKNFAAVLFPDLRGGWILNYENGYGLVRWRYQPDSKVKLSPAERARMAESIKKSNLRKLLLGWARRKARTNGWILHNWNLTAFWAAERLRRNSDDMQAQRYQADAYDRLTRLEEKQAILLSKDVGTILEVYRAEKGNP